MSGIGHPAPSIGVLVSLYRPIPIFEVVSCHILSPQPETKDRLICSRNTNRNVLL
jgi:hypothetical protein